MPFLRFSRDNRGYEYVYLVHAAARRGRSDHPRLLYWYRTPPGVKVGRKPFDEEAQRLIEAQNPGVVFDWAAIIATPPPPEPEPWRERRRAERAAKQSRRDDPEEDEASAGEATAEPDRPDRPLPMVPDAPGIAGPVDESAVSHAATSGETPGPVPVTGTARRRRRGGRRRGTRPDGMGAVANPTERGDDDPGPESGSTGR